MQALRASSKQEIIDYSADMDKQESEDKTKLEKISDDQNNSDRFNSSEYIKGTQTEQNMFTEYKQTGRSKPSSNQMATDDMVESDTSNQRNTKPRVKAEVSFAGSLTLKPVGEDVHLSSLEEEMVMSLKEELEREKKLSRKLLENAKTHTAKLEESFYKMEKEHVDRFLRLQEENNTNLTKVQSMLDKDRNNELLIKSLQGEVTKLTIDKQSFGTKVKELTSQIEKQDRMLHNRQRVIDDLFKSLSKENETLKQVKSQQSKLLKTERDNASAIQQNLEKENQKWRDAYDRKRKEYESNLESTKHHYECIAKEQTQYSAAVEASLREQIRIQNKNHDDLLLRYGKLVGESPTMGYANVTDLSDPSRPTKLAEQFSELYDNEWIDSFEELESISDREKINYLLLILQRACELSSDLTASEWLSRCYYTTFKDYKHFGISVCDEDFEDSTASDVKGEDIDRSKQTPTNDAYEHSRDSSGDTTDITDPTNIGTNKEDTDQTEQSTKNDAHEHSRDSNGDNTYLRETEEKGIEDDDTFMQYAEDNFMSPKQQEPANNNGNRNEEDSVSGTDFQGGSSVDPPSETNEDSFQMAADETSVDPVADMPLVNKETVRVQNVNLLVIEVPHGELKTEREQVAMKVFPHLKKKVLSCSSEQIQKVITDCLMKEFNVPTEATNLVKFVEKCGELCLKMGLKDPPLHIDFMKEGIPDQTHFNAEQYKAYTKKGKYLHYVVWPCLFLEKGGPLLCKGTAQGRPD